MPDVPKPTRAGLFPLRTGEKVLAAFSILGLIAAGAIALTTSGHEFLFYIVIVGLIMLAVTAVHARVHLSQASLWALFAWAVLHMAGGMSVVPSTKDVLYNFWLIPGLFKYDQLVHAYGFGITAWVVWQALCTIARPPFTSVGLLAASALAATGLGALNEVIEFIATKRIEKTNVGDYDNNAWDLVFNLAGAVIAVVVIRLTAWRSPATPGPRPQNQPSRPGV